MNILSSRDYQITQRKMRDEMTSLEGMRKRIAEQLAEEDITHTSEVLIAFERLVSSLAILTQLPKLIKLWV